MLSLRFEVPFAIARRLQRDLAETRIELESWRHAAEVHERSLQSVAGGTIIGELQGEIAELKEALAVAVCRPGHGCGPGCEKEHEHYGRRAAR